MSAVLAVARTPEEEELERKRAELARLESELCERELQLQTIRAELLAFDREYLAVVGLRYAELDRLKAAIAQAVARAAPNDTAAQEHAKESRKRARESAWAAGGPDGFEDAVDAPVNAAAFQPSAELKKLYKKSARLFHPDFVADESEKARRQSFLKRLNEAYAAGDEAAIRRLLDEWHSSPENVEGDGAGADLVRVIRQIAQIEKRLRAIEAEIAELEDSELFELRSQVEQAKAAGRNLIHELARQLDDRIAEAQHEFARVA